jgi:O-palmitoleoyl-L-serine hydrolase
VNLFYRGRSILEALIRELISERDLASSDALVVTGSSAGGLSTYLHVDFLAAALPGVTVVGVPDAGFFPLSPAFNGAYTFTQDTLVWMVSAFNISAAAQVNAACFAATPTGFLASCLAAPMFYSRVESPLYVVNSQEDWAQLTGWASLVRAKCFSSHSLRTQLANQPVNHLLCALAAPSVR